MATICNTFTKVLLPNETWVKPKNAEITFISETDDVESTCNIEGIASSMICYQFDFPLQGADRYSSPVDFYLTSFKFDSYILNITPSPALESGIFIGAETGQQYVDRIANAIWNANNASPNPVIQGVQVGYQEAAVPGHKVSIILKIPSVYEDVIMNYIDNNTFAVDTENPAMLSSIPRVIDCAFRTTIGSNDDAYKILGNV